jgi:dipeptidyl aminopeptidase/acylaminoacyl peptidase
LKSFVHHEAFLFLQKIQSMRLFILVAFIACNYVIHAQGIPNNSTLSLKEIMKGNEFIGHQPEYVRWSVDGQAIYFEWNPLNEPGNSTYQFSLDPKINTHSLADPKTVIEYDWNQRNYGKNYYSIDGALVAYDKKTKKRSLIYHSASPVHSIQRTNQENSVFFQQGQNLFCYDAASGTIRQMTNFISGEEKSTKTDSSYLMKEEARLFEFIQDKNERKAWREKQEVTMYTFPKAFYFGKESIENIQIDPNAHYVSFRLSNYPTEKVTHVENHISSDGHTYASPARAKVSNIDASHRLGIYSIEKDTVFFVDFSKLTDIRKKPAYLNDPTPYTADRKFIMHSLKFAKASKFAVCDIRSYDNKDRWIVLIDLSNGTFTEIERQHDEAWIGGPGISSWNSEEGTLGWLNDDQKIYFQSEETGYSHLYFYSIGTQKKEQITSGKWEVHQIQLSNDGTKIYLTCNRSHPGNRDFLRYDIIARKIVPILQKDGYHEVVLSPDEKTLAVRYSYKNQPWELYKAPNVSNTQLTKLTHSTTKSFESYKWREPKVITFKGTDGKDVYARVYNPENAKNKAAVIFVHGAGYLQNAHNYWSNYHREYMFHNMLVDNGFTVLDIDYRASEGYGRDYRTAIYRHMGGQDLQDHLVGKDYLVNELGIDSTRIGIYGGSYGGFITLMAMLTTPGEFPCGAALRSVTDWAHYNHEYTSNILNYPETDPASYQKSSPIYYANQLEGKLLMLHGMVDDNVQFQDVVRLSQRFIELGKENWELAVFPVEAHGFKESYSWNDEYRRIYELFYTELVLKQAK